MQRSTTFIAGLLCVLGGTALADTAPPQAAALVQSADLKPVPEGGIYIGAGGGVLPVGHAAGSAFGSLVVDRPLFWRMGFWMSGEGQGIVRDPESSLALRLCFGFRIDMVRTESRKVRLQGTLAFAHQHEAPISGWRDHPGENLLGESSSGLGHRSGVEAGVGVLFTPWIDSRNGFLRRTRALVRFSAMWLPDDAGPPLYLALITSVGMAL
jgi:hypothetical protein